LGLPGYDENTHTDNSAVGASSVNSLKKSFAKNTLGVVGVERSSSEIHKKQEWAFHGTPLSPVCPTCGVTVVDATQGKEHG